VSDRPQNKHLTPFKKGEIHNPNGRPKKIMRRLEELVGQKFGLELTKTDKYQLIEYCLEKNIDELKSIATDEKSPVFLVSIALAIMGDMKLKRINTVEAIFDRVFGKPVQKQDQTGKVEIIVKYDK